MTGTPEVWARLSRGISTVVVRMADIVAVTPVSDEQASYGSKLWTRYDGVPIGVDETAEGVMAAFQKAAKKVLLLPEEWDAIQWWMTAEDAGGRVKDPRERAYRESTYARDMGEAVRFIELHRARTPEDS